MAFGYIKQEMDGTEPIFKPSKTLSLPDEYSYMNYLPKALNQGKKPLCVPYSLSTFIDWKLNLDDGEIKDNNIDLGSIFDSRKSVVADGGMTFMDGLSFIKNDGVKCSDGIFTIDGYAYVGSPDVLKYAIVMNGPCVGALPVYNTSMERFWNDKFGSFIGAHAISIVGYDRNGFIIRNSWGNRYGYDGYGHLDNDDFHLFYEIWTLIK